MPIPTAAKKALQAYARVSDLWGNVRMGLILTHAYEAGVWVTMEELQQWTGLSHESVRRLINPLVSLGRVQVEKVGKKFHYQAAAQWALTTTKLLETFCSPPQSSLEKVGE